MIFRISNASERLVGTLDDGEEFVDALSDICKKKGVKAGEIRAVGQFRAIELVRFDAETQSYQTIVDGEGSFDLVNLNGNISMLGDEVVLRLDALFNVMGPLGAQVVGGQLRRADVVSSEFVIDSFSDLRMERSLDASSGRLALSEIERIAGPEASAKTVPLRSNVRTVTKKTAAAAPAKVEEVEEPAEVQQSSMSWGDAIAETEEAEKKRIARKNGRTSKKGVMGSKKESSNPFEDLDLENPWMRPGDLLDHPKLGRCRVIKVEDDHYAHIRLPRGRIRKLALEILDVEFKGEEDGTNVFQARVRR